MRRPGGCSISGYVSVTLFMRWVDVAIQLTTRLLSARTSELLLHRNRMETVVCEGHGVVTLSYLVSYLMVEPEDQTQPPSPEAGPGLRLTIFLHNLKKTAGFR